MLNFCTLFDSNYLSRGLALYESLIRHCPDFHLYIFAFNDKCFNYLTENHLNKTTIISLKEFEDEELLRVKPTRSIAEYCWTCTPSTILYVIEKFQTQNCIYIDSDLMFYANPQILLSEMNDTASVMITDHRYSPDYDQSRFSGKYCVQFMYFKNDIQGMTVLKWWRAACLEWCYSRIEQGRFGDQKYLDAWPIIFKGVHELEHLGGGIAPWNVQQYEVSLNGTKLIGKDLKTNHEFDVVFYHFHGLKFFTDNIISLSGKYELSENIRNHFYIPYIKKLETISDKIIDKSFDPHGTSSAAPSKPYTFAEKNRFIRRCFKFFFQACFAEFKNLIKLKYYIKKINSNNYFYLNEIKKD